MFLKLKDIITPHEMYNSVLFLWLVVGVCAQENKVVSIVNSIYSKLDTTTRASQQHTTVPPVSQPEESKYRSCTTNNNEKGICVLHYHCDEKVITNGRGLIDIRITPIGCSSYLEVCCKVPGTIDPEKIRPDSPDSKPPIDEPPRKEGCGSRNPNGVGFKTTGDTNGESKFGEFPWMVAIFDATSPLPINPRIANSSSSSVPVYIGGGSLIHPAVVLTTAHRVVSVTNLKVRAGEWDAQTVDEIYPYQERDVASKIIHKDFQEGILSNDIALLFLSSPMNTSIPNVGLACLPPPNQVTPGRTPCIATGWGKDKFGKEGQYQVILKKITIPIVERKLCQRQLSKTRLGPFFELHSSFICAGGEAGIDTCTGDGGAPLVCPIENETDRYMQIGMVAWGIECGIKDVPAVYVDVSKFRVWIDNNLYNMKMT